MRGIVVSVLAAAAVVWGCRPSQVDPPREGLPSTPAVHEEAPQITAPVVEPAAGPDVADTVAEVGEHAPDPSEGADAVREAASAPEETSLRVVRPPDTTDAPSGKAPDEDPEESPPTESPSLVLGSEVLRLAAPDGHAYDYFGGSVSISSDGSTIVVGAAEDDMRGTDSGSVYVFEHAERGVLTPGVLTKLSADDTAAWDRFGYSLCVSERGTVLVIGSPFDDEGENDVGSVSVYVRSPDGWSREGGKLVAVDGSAGDNFGCSVAVSGDGRVMVVGAKGSDGDVADAGAVYVVRRDSGSTITAVKLVSPSPDTHVSLGQTVAVSASGDTIAAGAAGAAYVFSRPANGWARGGGAARLTPSTGAAGDLGGSVSISSDGSIVVAGARRDGQSGPNSGAVYVFVRPAGGWRDGHETAILTASDAAPGDGLGSSVSVSPDGRVVAAGARGADDRGGGSGSVYLFVRPAGGWRSSTEEEKLVADDGEPDDNFGSGVAVSEGGAVIAVGAWWDDANGADSGSVYVFR